MALLRADSRFADAADAVVSRMGLEPAQRADVKSEVLCHMVDLYETERARGADQAGAVEHALAAFGAANTIRRRLLLARIWREFRSCWRVGGVARTFMLTDVAAALVLATLQMTDTNFLSRMSWLMIACPLITLYYWITLSLARTGWSIAGWGRRAGDSPALKWLGYSLVVLAIGVWVAERPGLLSLVLERSTRESLNLLAWRGWLELVPFVGVVAATIATLRNTPRLMEDSDVGPNECLV